MAGQTGLYSFDWYNDQEGNIVLHYFVKDNYL